MQMLLVFELSARGKKIRLLRREGTFWCWPAQMALWVISCHLLLHSCGRALFRLRCAFIVS